MQIFHNYQFKKIKDHHNVIIIIEMLTLLKSTKFDEIFQQLFLGFIFIKVICEHSGMNITHTK